MQDARTKSRKVAKRQDFLDGEDAEKIPARQTSFNTCQHGYRQVRVTQLSDFSLYVVRNVVSNHFTAQHG